MRSQGVPSPFFPAQRGISDHLPLPTKGIPQGCFLKGPRFWSRARSRLLAKAARVSGGKICPEFAPRRSRPHSALPSFDYKLLFAVGHYPSFRLKIHLSHCGPRGQGQRDISLRSNCGAGATIGRRGPANLAPETFEEELVQGPRVMLSKRAQHVSIRHHYNAASVS